MQDYAFYVSDTPIAAKRDSGVWLEVPTGTAFLQVYLTRYAAIGLMQELQSVLRQPSASVSSFRDHG